jgi:MFS family permease
MVCNRITYRSWVQMIFFVGYMVGSIVFGILADKFVLFLFFSNINKNINLDMVVVQ